MRLFSIIGCTLIILLTFIMGDYWPSIWPDEVLFFSPSFNLANSGKMFTDVLEGFIPGMGEATYWMPPVYFIFNSILFFIFHPGLEITRLGNVFLSFIIGYLLNEILKIFKFQTKYRILTLFIVFTDYLFLRVTHTGRMETLCQLFLLGSYLLQIRYYLNEKKSNLENILSGILFGLAILTHPFAVVCFFPILFLLYERKKRFLVNFFIFSLFVGLTCSFWCFYIIQDFDLFLIQFGAQLNRKKELFNFFSLIDSLKIFLNIYYFSKIRFLLMFSLILGILLSLKNQKNRERIDLFLMIWFFNSLLFQFFFSETWYIFYLILPSCLLLGNFLHNKNYYFQYLLYAFLVFNIILLGIHIYYFQIFDDVSRRNQEYFQEISKMTKNSETIYINSIPDPYFYLHKQNPHKRYYEFIPGELQIPIHKEKLESIEAFIISDELYSGKQIKDYLNRNSNRFEKKVIQISLNSNRFYNFYATIYLKKD